MEFVAILGIYFNGHISRTEEIEFEAKDYEEARIIANEKAEEYEFELMRDYDPLIEQDPDEEIWVNADRIYGEDCIIGA